MKTLRLIAFIGLGVGWWLALIAIPNRAAPPQVPAGVTVSGRIEDQAGDVVPVVRVNLKELPSGANRHTTTNASGQFQFENLAPGQYQLKAEAAGYQAGTQTITVANKPLTKIKLQLGINLADDITISATVSRAEQAALATRNADRVNWDDKLLRALPMSGLDMLPSVSNFLSPAAFDGDGASIVVDGVETGSAGLSPNVIEHLRINRNPYAAQFRRPGKARVEISTRNGANKRFHGGASILTRNSIFDARNAFALTKPQRDRRLYEVNLNGPLVPQRLTFLLSGERLNNEESAIIQAQTLTGTVQQNVLVPEGRTRLFSRLDFKATERHRLTLRYDLNAQTEQNQHLGGLRLASQAYDSNQRRHTWQFTEHAILSPRWLNDFRVVWQRLDDRVGVLSTQPEISVAGAFIGGAPQRFSTNAERGYIVQNNASYFRDKHEMRMGLEARGKTVDATEADNFGGTFRFADLTQYAAGRPFQYRLRRGAPQIEFAQHEVAGFVQDEWKPRAGLTLSLGARYQVQTNVSDANNLAPRFGFAAAPRAGKTVIRGGAGAFYERVSESVRQRALLNDGVRLQEFVVRNPSYPTPPTLGAQTLPSLTRVAADLVVPYQWQASLGVEQEVMGRNLVTIEYQILRGLHLLRSRNVNAPLPSTGLRLDAQYLNINQVEASAQARAHAWTISWRGRVTKRFQPLANYTWMKAWNDTNGRFELPADNYNLRPEWGYAEYDQRHRFNLAGLLDLPYRLRLGTIWNFTSGRPFDITTGRDDNGDTTANDRPAGITRNTGRAAGFARVDVRFAKSFAVPQPFPQARKNDEATVELNIDAFNVFNHTNPTDYIGVQTSPFFGQPTTAARARTLQFSLRYRF